MNCYVGLLRAVNVGGTSKVPMAELRAHLGDAGLGNVRTYIQSGNVLFESACDPADLANRIEGVIRERFGVTTPAILRTRDQLAAALAAYPFPLDSAPEKLHHIVFLRDVPAPERAAKLDPHRDPAAAFRLTGRDLHIRYGEGVAGSKLTAAYIDATLGTAGTARNLRTVRTLLEMLEA